VIIVLTGPTAVGKTKLSLILAKLIENTIIVSVDSRQVYRFMDIGTDKVSKEIRKYIPHYLIDIVNPSFNFSLFDFLSKTKKIIEFAKSKKKNIIFVGGTVLYVMALVNGYSLLPTKVEIRSKYESLNFDQLRELIYDFDKKFNTNFSSMYKDKRRMVRILEVYEITNKNPLDIWKNNSLFPIDEVFILNDYRNTIYENINKRVDKQIKGGLVEEVKFIVKKFPDSRNFKSMKTFGYLEIIDYLENKFDLSTAIDNIKKNTRRFAKRQISFLKKLNGEYLNIYEFKNDFNLIASYIYKLIKN
jgi:tRNA dimethylallyltransferase